MYLFVYCALKTCQDYSFVSIISNKSGIDFPYFTMAIAVCWSCRIPCVHRRSSQAIVVLSICEIEFTGANSIQIPTTATYAIYPRSRRSRPSTKCPTLGVNFLSRHDPFSGFIIRNETISNRTGQITIDAEWNRNVLTEIRTKQTIFSQKDFLAFVSSFCYIAITRKQVAWWVARFSKANERQFLHQEALHAENLRPRFFVLNFRHDPP